MVAVAGELRNGFHPTLTTLHRHCTALHCFNEWVAEEDMGDNTSNATLNLDPWTDGKNEAKRHFRTNILPVTIIMRVRVCVCVHACVTSLRQGLPLD